MYTKTRIYYNYKTKDGFPLLNHWYKSKFLMERAIQKDGTNILVMFENNLLPPSSRAANLKRQDLNQQFHRRVSMPLYWYITFINSGMVRLTQLFKSRQSDKYDFKGDSKGQIRSGCNKSDVAAISLQGRWYWLRSLESHIFREQTIHLYICYDLPYKIRKTRTTSHLCLPLPTTKF